MVSDVSKIIYFGAGCLWAVAGIRRCLEIGNRKELRNLEKAIGNEFPDEEGKSAYVAVRCFGTLICPPMNPKDRKALLCRYHIEQIKSHTNLGLGVPMGGKDGASAVIVPSVDSIKSLIGFPAETVLGSERGPIHSKWLKLATWDKCRTLYATPTPHEAAIAFGELNFPVDFNADKYKITIEYFPESALTIIGECIKRGHGYEITQPQDGQPFIVTPLTPDELLNRTRTKAERFKTNTFKCFISGLFLGIGAASIDISIMVNESYTKSFWRSSVKVIPITSFLAIPLLLSQDLKSKA